MNTLVEFLNACGGRFVDAAWPMLWQSGVLIALVFALDLALRKRVRATTRYALWLLVLAKLLVPASFSLPTGAGYWIPAPTALTAAQPDAASSLRLEPSSATSTESTKSTTSTAASSLPLDRNRRTELEQPPAGPLNVLPTPQPPAALAAGQTLHWRGVAALCWLAGMAGLSGALAFRARLRPGA